ncbi:MAG: hypothetical protein ABSB33_09910 [Tepidisphaeraceae bacterium]|jgi:hypothetical protein
MVENLPRPILSYVNQQITGYKANPDFELYDATVRLVFNQWKANTDPRQVLAKVVVLNRLYSTNVYDVLALKRRILEVDHIDDKLSSGDHGLVEEIARVTVGGKPRFFFSFATKYCAWHEPDKFQMFDSYVEWILWEYKKDFGFAGFGRTELRNYERYVAILKKFRSFFCLPESELPPKLLDKFLWIEGQNQWQNRKQPSDFPEPVDDSKPTHHLHDGIG